MTMVVASGGQRRGELPRSQLGGPTPSRARRRRPSAPAADRGGDGGRRGLSQEGKEEAKEASVFMLSRPHGFCNSAKGRYLGHDESLP